MKIRMANLGGTLSLIRVYADAEAQTQVQEPQEHAGEVQERIGQVQEPQEHAGEVQVGNVNSANSPVVVS